MYSRIPNVFFEIFAYTLDLQEAVFYHVNPFVNQLYHFRIINLFKLFFRLSPRNILFRCFFIINLKRINAKFNNYYLSKYDILKPNTRDDYMNKSKTPLRLLFVGPPGAGKGSMSYEVSSYYKIPHLSTGDMLRDNIAKKTEIGVEAQKLIDQGNFVSDEMAITMVKNRLQEDDCKPGCIFDGFPRTLEQAVMLDSLKNFKPNVVAYMNLNDDEAIDRICNRLVHQASGRIYNKKYHPPKTPGLDDITGDDLTIRPDDNEEVAIRRLKVYYELTMPIKDFYLNQSEKSDNMKFIELQAYKSLGIVFDDLIHSVDNFLKKSNENYLNIE